MSAIESIIVDCCAGRRDKSALVHIGKLHGIQVYIQVCVGENVRKLYSYYSS